MEKTKRQLQEEWFSRNEGKATLKMFIAYLEEVFKEWGENE